MVDYGNDGNVQCIVFTGDVYGDDLWKVVSRQVGILVRQGYEVQVYEEDTGIVVIRFAYVDKDMTRYRIEWVTDEEYDYLYDIREQHGCCDCWAECDCCGETHSEGSADTEYEQIDLATANNTSWDEVMPNK